jgi:hypothetical protein
VVSKATHPSIHPCTSITFAWLFRWSHLEMKVMKIKRSFLGLENDVGSYSLNNFVCSGKHTNYLSEKYNWSQDKYLIQPQTLQPVFQEQTFDTQEKGRYIRLLFNSVPI